MDERGDLLRQALGQQPGHRNVDDLGRQPAAQGPEDAAEDAVGRGLLQLGLEQDDGAAQHGAEQGVPDGWNRKRGQE